MLYMDFRLKNSRTLYNRLAFELSTCLEETNIPELGTKGKTTLIQKEPWKRNQPKQQLADYVSSYNMENPNNTD